MGFLTIRISGAIVGGEKERKKGGALEVDHQVKGEEGRATPLHGHNFLYSASLFESVGFSVGEIKAECDSATNRKFGVDVLPVRS